MITPYPAGIDTSVANLIGYLRGTGNVPADEAVHSGWHLLGFGLSVAVPHVHPIGVQNQAPLGKAAFADELEKIQHKDAAGPATSDPSQAIPWDLIISSLLPLLLEWLRNR